MLYPVLTAAENVEFAARLHGLPDASNVARHALDGMGILDRAGVPVRALSRGLQQRVAIARSTVHRPKLLLCDEPFGALDELGAQALAGLLERMRSEGSAIVLITHDIAQGLRHATHAAMMRDGRLAGVEPSTGIAPADYSARYRVLCGLSDVA